MKKGFTLVELLAVIVILALVASITYPLVTHIMINAKESAAETQEKLLIRAAHNWGAEHTSLLSDTVGDVYALSIETLQEEGYISEGDVVDINRNKLLNNACVKITTEQNKYLYELDRECSE